MSKNTNWDIEEQREEHESDEQWALRKAFMDRWKDNYDQDRLVCLARVFANIEFMGCRYPQEVMKEVSRLAEDIANSYRQTRKGKLQRTFVLASDAAEDRAKGIRREAGAKTTPTKINFLPAGHSVNRTPSDNEPNPEEPEIKRQKFDESAEETKCWSHTVVTDYQKELTEMPLLNLCMFREQMFFTEFGQMVLLIRPWVGRFGNIFASCTACQANIRDSYIDGIYTLVINNKIVANASGFTKSEARSVVETLAWNRLKSTCISLLMKEQFIAQNDTRITSNDVVGERGNDTRFGAPIENSVAIKMMKLMGWTGKGLGAEAQGIEEPVKPTLQMVNRAGLGSSDQSMNSLKNSARTLMLNYRSSDSIDVDLVFSAEFSKEERAALHQVAQRVGLKSNSYGKDAERFLVVKKKRKNPFELVKEVLSKGGCTQKYEVFIPAGLQ